jgi:simple sugar transport system permease protein
VFGALTLGMTKNGLQFAGIGGDWYLAFLGALLLLAVIVNNYIRQRAALTRH